MVFVLRIQFFTIIHHVIKCNKKVGSFTLSWKDTWSAIWEIVSLEKLYNSSWTMLVSYNGVSDNWSHLGIRTAMLLATLYCFTIFPKLDSKMVSTWGGVIMLMTLLNFILFYSGTGHKGSDYEEQFWVTQGNKLCDSSTVESLTGLMLFSAKEFPLVLVFSKASSRIYVSLIVTSEEFVGKI